MKRLMIISGGTGGHIIPGITIAQYLINRGWKVKWLGTMDRMESYLVPQHGIEIDFIKIPNFRNKNIKTLIWAPIIIFNAWRQARFIMKQFKPNIVLGMGGYISGPSGLAAWSLGIPIIIHEQNRIAGLTNKLLARIAKKVTQAFFGAFSNAEVVGNPIRSSILSLPSPNRRLKDRKGPIRLLVIGGSQGTKLFNQIIPIAASKLNGIITIWHQSGKGQKHYVKKAYVNFGQTQHKITEFIENIALAYSWADLIICRSGALTVSEIAVVGLPAIFVPFQHKDRQQYLNALLLEKVGAAKIFEQSQFNVNLLVEILTRLNRKTLLKMANCARTIAIVDSTQKIVKEIIFATKI